jgi:hypothetical protein
VPPPAGLARSYLSPALPCCCDNQSSSPAGARLVPIYPRLAPWAAFLRRQPRLLCPPPGLKPASLLALSGTAEAVPFPQNHCPALAKQLMKWLIAKFSMILLAHNGS